MQYFLSGISPICVIFLNVNNLLSDNIEVLSENSEGVRAVPRMRQILIYETRYETSAEIQSFRPKGDVSRRGTNGEE